MTGPSSSKKPLFQHILLIVCVVALCLTVSMVLSNRRLISQYWTYVAVNNNKLSTVYYLLNRLYVDTIDRPALEEKAIMALMNELDPHSMYLPAKEMQSANEKLEGSFSGIGVEYMSYRDTIVVTGIIPGGPSEQVGLQIGDRIVTVEDSLIAGVSFPADQIQSLLRGPSGTAVRIGIRRRTADSLVHKTVIRAAVPIVSIDVAYMLPGDIGYIKLNKFARTTLQEFKSAVDRLREAGMTKLVLDLRDNTGGYMDPAIGLLGEFFPKDSLLVYTEGRAKRRKNYYGSGNMSCADLDMMLLINESTASSAEIVAGAFQDYERAVIVGRRSYGKGLVQEQITLNDGSAVRITVARYYTPLGRCIQKPYTMGDDATYNQDLYQRYLHGEMMDQDSIKMDETNAVQTAVSHKTLYGGNGIMPDVFVPLDTSYYSVFYTQVNRKRLPSMFAFEYADAHRTQLEAFNDFADLDAYVRRTDFWDRFLTFAAAHDVRVVPEQTARSGAYLRNLIIAYIARYIYGDFGFYPILNQMDTTFRQALSLWHPEEENHHNN